MSEVCSSFKHMELFLVFLAILTLGAIAVFFIFVASLFSGANHQLQSHNVSQDLGGMDEGDYHSGPHGYSPNTAYPETQYGSNFDEDADWNEER
jgi:hypothetical protein